MSFLILHLLFAMIVYNITTKIHPSIEKEWIPWQKEVQIPGILSTGLFTDHKFLRLLEQDETDGITYVIQYFTSSIEEYKKFIDEFATPFGEKTAEKWRDKYISFQTVMQIVN